MSDNNNNETKTRKKRRRDPGTGPEKHEGVGKAKEETKSPEKLNGIVEHKVETPEVSPHGIEDDIKLDASFQPKTSGSEELAKRNPVLTAKDLPLSEASVWQFSETEQPNQLTVHEEKPRELAQKKTKLSLRSAVDSFALENFGGRLPRLKGFEQVYDQAAIPRVYESYLSTSFFVSSIVAIATLAVSLFLEILLFHVAILRAVVGSLVLGCVAFGLCYAIWIIYPIQRRNNFKNKLESQLPYSFGVLGVLAASGMNVDRMFEGISASESNPVLANLARRFLRNVRVFGMDIESALSEVSRHSPSGAFSRMLESISVAFRTTDSLHNLIMFESGRLFAEKRDRLKKSVGSLAVMAELYITLIVVGPIIFIVLLTIFLFLPLGKGVPDPTLLINIMIFIGIPALSAMFVLILDSMVQKV